MKHTPKDGATKSTHSTAARLALRMGELAQLAQQMRAVDDEVARGEQSLGAGFQDVARGAKVPAERQEELSRLQAKRLTLHAMVRAANAAVEDAKATAFARGIVENRGAMRSLLAEYYRHAEESERHLDQATISLTAMREAVQKVLLNFRTLRSRDAVTEKGIISLGAAGLVVGGELQWKVSQHLHLRTNWWREERGMRFMDSARGAFAGMESAFDELMGLTALDPKHLAAAMADIQADARRSGVALPALENRSDDSEALITGAGDLHDPRS